MIDKTEYYNSVGKFIRSERAALSISQQDLSKETGVSMRVISAIENNKVISDKKIAALLDYFKADLVIKVEIKKRIVTEEK